MLAAELCFVFICIVYYFLLLLIGAFNDISIFDLSSNVLGTLRDFGDEFSFQGVLPSSVLIKVLMMEEAQN